MPVSSFALKILADALNSILSSTSQGETSRTLLLVLGSERGCSEIRSGCDVAPLPASRQSAATRDNLQKRWHESFQWLSAASSYFSSTTRGTSTLVNLRLASSHRRNPAGSTFTAPPSAFVSWRKPLCRMAGHDYSPSRGRVPIHISTPSRSRCFKNHFVFLAFEGVWLTLGSHASWKVWTEIPSQLMTGINQLSGWSTLNFN